jgi:hypothetical protein
MEVGIGNRRNQIFLTESGVQLMLQCNLLVKLLYAVA